MKIERFEDIRCWKLARELTRWIYEKSSRGEFARDHGLNSQMQRAAVSIMSNIAEGFDRSSNKEFAQFLSVAKASCAELRSHLYVALDNGYITQADMNAASTMCEEVAGCIANFIKYLRSSKMKGKRYA